MDCRKVEDHLSEYLDRTLSAEDAAKIARHVQDCSACHDLQDEVQSLLVSLRTITEIEPDIELIERILLRTTGRPRTRSWGEIFSRFVFRPVWTPRFAVGALLSLLFLVFSMNLMGHRVNAVASALAPSELFRRLDRMTQQIYSEGLKAYDKKNEWQAQFNYFKNNVFNKLGFMIEQLDVPMEGNDQSGEPGQQQQKAPTEKSSVMLLPV